MRNTKKYYQITTSNIFEQTDDEDTFDTCQRILNYFFVHRKNVSDFPNVREKLLASHNY